ncbi:MAG: response regulator transcription factor [Anaerolineales bacterium]|nr:response regulator transcription factor [Anaerolineales bacterium]
MPKDIHVLLIEDDVYARDLMSMLLTRDWRTRVIGEVGSENDVENFLNDPLHRIGAVVLDTEVPGDPDWPFRVAAHAQRSTPHPHILFTATQPDANTLRRIIEHKFHGYIIKREIGYGLAATIALAVKQGKWVTTRGVYQLALRERIHLPENAALLDGTKPVGDLTPREAEIARLAILFNHPHRDLSDELIIRADQVSKHVSSVYTKLGLDEIMSGEVTPETYFQDQLVLQRFRGILSRIKDAKSVRKTADMATLAFHLLTVPEVTEPR